MSYLVVSRIYFYDYAKIGNIIGINKKAIGKVLYFIDGEWIKLESGLYNSTYSMRFITIVNYQKSIID